MKRFSPAVVLGILLAGLVLGPVGTLAFDTNKAAEGPLSVTIEPIDTVVEREKTQTLSVTLANDGPGDLAVELELTGLVDECRPGGSTKQQVRVPAGGKTAGQFSFVCGDGCLSAHYPVRVRAGFELAGQRKTLEPVQVFRTEFAAPTVAGPGAAGDRLPLEVVPQRGAVPLATVDSQRVAWNYYDQPTVFLAPGWEGRDETSSASFSRGRVMRGGEWKQSLQMHPPYRPRGGSIFAEYRLKLPAQGPIALSFANAIRDSSPREGASDGVTFRVWVGEEKLFERHSDSKTWLPGEVDLSRFAGREVLLRLESHPGPRHNTSCDSSYWGDPIVTAGAMPKMLTAAEREALGRAALDAAAGRAPGDSVFAFDLAGGARAAVALGPNGLADSAMAFSAAGRSVAVDGWTVTLEEQAVGAWPSGMVSDEVKASRDARGRVRVEQRLRRNDLALELTAELWAEGPGLRVRFSSPARIDDLAMGPANQQAARVYYGHGYVIERPEAFRASGGGHNLATSHVGFDFDGGLSLLVAADTPVDALEVDPERRLYALHAHPGTMFTFVPGAAGAMDCAVRYRPLYDKRPAPGVAKKAGRFVFDYWGGRYSENADLLEEAFAYGLTDAMAILHVWQRWGYDNRLPDIYPPDPKLGTLEDLQRVGRVCAERGVLFGLHDNYIDFYPDADGFTYDHITFDRQGRPRKAWINTGRDAQSYQWRPDRFRPFLERNLALVTPALRPTNYFVDVFTSANCFDYYDRQGVFHSRLETRKCWGESFALIRQTLGDDAPTVSEAGSDNLVGYLDGADCQFLRLVQEPRYHCTRLKCADWDRVPWFDAVNHTRFSLHGVGYSGRYQGELSRALAGIESDDYISAELLTGHALMIDRPAGLRGAVRKYWLAQAIARSLADDEIVRVQQPEGNIHRVAVEWKSGAKVWVNRAGEDWSVAGRALPQFGYLATSGERESAIERRGGAVVEQSRAPGWCYVNGRGYEPDAPLEIRPTAKRVEYLGNREFRLLIDWDVLRPTDKDLAVKMAFFRPQLSRLVKTGFQVDRVPRPSASTWRGTVTTGQDWTVTVPEDCPAGEYEVLVGVSDRGTRPAQRLRLLGDEDPERRCRLGMLVLEGKGATITGARLEPGEGEPALAARLRPNAKATDFGSIRTAGALRCEIRADRLVVTPLPGEAPLAADLDVTGLAGRPAAVESVAAVDAAGKTLREVRFEVSGGRVSFSTGRDEFAYEVRLK